MSESDVIIINKQLWKAKIKNILEHTESILFQYTIEKSIIHVMHTYNTVKQETQTIKNIPQCPHDLHIHL